jgi:bla regulator protein BlaR1
VLRVFNDKTNKWEKLKLSGSEKERGSSDDSTISFTIVDKSPTFPGCESGVKDCFSKMVQTHFSKNFDNALSNNLGLDSGKKRVFIAFIIDDEGNVVDLKARAPHIDIKNEVIRVMNTLPKMIPGENNGKKVAVKYAIPFTIIVG